MVRDRGGGRVTSTVRFRITALASVAVAAVLVATAVGLVLVQRRALTDSLDESLAAAAGAIAEEIGDADDPAGVRLDDPAVDDDALAQVVVDGNVVATTEPDVTQPLGPPDGSPASTTVESVTDEDGAFRVATRPVDGARATLVHVAAPLDDVEESTGLLARSLALAVPAVTALLAVLVWALAGRTLRPVEGIRREVARIGTTDLRRRVPVPPGDDEVARLAGTMNAMLDRVEDAAERQRRFVGDASHELRTPLARMRSELEVDLAHPGLADPSTTHRSVLDETIGMQRLVDDLLRLARADGARPSGSRPGSDRTGPGPADRPSTTRLDLAAGAEVSHARAASPVVLDATALAPVSVAVEEQEVRRVVANLLDNATRHARSHVEVAVRDGGGVARLTVTDDGQGVPDDEAERIFERFARLDDARSAGQGGAGLGLAIAREIAERHGGTLALDTAHLGGARFVLELPSVPAAGG
jgi:signal transduction histidine kinase